MRLIRPTVAAAQIHNYLQTIPDDHTSIDLKPLETFIADVCSRVENATLLNILEDYGWDGESSQFDPNRIDIPGLRVALSRKSLLLTTRTSQLGPNLSPKSFAPAMLLSYLCYLANKEHSYSVDLRGSYIVSGDRPNQTEIAAAAAAAAAIQGETINIKLSPASFFFRGVCLLVDISGFTRLSGSFCALGKVGIDGLQQATNGYMGSLVEVIYKYGGDIIKFAGDAIICVFLEKDVRKSISAGHGSGISHQPSSKNQCVINQNVCILAMHCAMRLREICTETLTVHVAVSCGEMCFGIVGGCNDKWECLISGDCLMELSQCLEDAPSKQVAVTGYFGEVVGSDILHDFGGEVLPSGNYRLTMKPNETSQLESEDEDMIIDWVIQSSRPEYMKAVNMFVPLPVTLAFESGGLRYLAEIREVTTMFMKWDSYNTTDYADLVQLQRPFLECQTILHELGGFVRQFLVDDKGCVLIACWGVPTAAFLNNAHRALSAAAKIRAKFHELSLQCSIGITTGNVYCGNVGSEIRREYAAVGDVVNLSARLMSKAHGGIYIDEATYARLPVSIWCLFEELEQSSRFSEVRPILIYSWMGDELSIPNTLGCGGEEFQVKTVCRSILLRALDRVQVVAGTYEDTCRARTAATATSSRPVSVATSLRTWAASPLSLQVIVLEGHLGSGKRTTVRWLLREAKLRSIRVVRVAHIEHRHSLLEYKAIAMLLQEFMGIADADSHLVRAALVNVLRLVYGEDMDTIENVAMPVMKTLFGSLLSEMSPAEGPASRNNARAPFKAVIDVLRPVFEALLKGAGTIVIIENLHFCDEGSLNCLTALMDLSVNALFVLALEPLERSRDIPIPSIKHIIGEEQQQSSQQRRQTFRGSSGHLFDIMQVFRNNILLVENSTYIYLNEFNLTDIDAMLHLALEPEVVPLGLAQWVQQLSGSSLAWANSIIQMIKANGLSAMMNVVYGSGSSASGLRTKSAGFLEGVGAVPTSSSSHSSDRLLNKTSFEDSRIRAQLKNLILCRFNQLSHDEQLVLKIASVIGTSFSFQILQGIVSPALRTHLHVYLRKLLAEKWIGVVEQNSTVVDSVNALFRSGGESATADNSSTYIFSHPMAWETIYETIPLDDRNAIHKIIAELYESKLNDDPSLIDRVASQYSHCSQSKSFEYAVKAACYYLRPDVQDMSKALSLLADCLTTCHFVMDVKVLQTLLKAIRDIVFCCHGSMDGTEVFVDPAVSRELSIRRNRRSEEEIEIPMDLETSCMLFFCCGGLGQVANNKVRPGTSNIRPTKSSSRSISINQNSHRSVSRRSARSGHSVQSVGTFQSQVSSYTMTSPVYTSSAADYILHNVMRIERVAARLKEQFEEAGKIGMLSLWQREIVFEEDMVIPEQSFKSATAFIRYARASWIRPATNT